jgi:hypothetical protein
MQLPQIVEKLQDIIKGLKINQCVIFHTLNILDEISECLDKNYRTLFGTETDKMIRSITHIQYDLGAYTDEYSRERVIEKLTELSEYLKKHYFSFSFVNQKVLDRIKRMEEQNERK